MSVLQTDPQSRTERYLYRIAGQDVELPSAPGSRVEELLSIILQNHGGSVTKTSDLINDSDFQTSEQVESAIRAELAGIVQVEWRVVQSLPALGEIGVIYLLPNNGTGNNVHDEYLWISTTSSFEKIGTTEVDLSGYAKTIDVNTALAAKQDKLPATGASNRGTYISSTGVVSAMEHTVDADVPAGADFNDTKNTAGATDSSAKLFLVGATAQTTNPQTYSQDTAYVGTDGCLYSGGEKVLTQHQDISDVREALDEKVDKVEGKALSANDYSDAEKSKVAQLREENAALWDIIQQINPSITKSAAGNPVIISDGYADAPLISATVDANHVGETVTLTRYGVQRDSETSIATETVTVGTGGVISSLNLTTLRGENIIVVNDGTNDIEATIQYRADTTYMRYDTYPTGTASGNPILRRRRGEYSCEVPVRGHRAGAGRIGRSVPGECAAYYGFRQRYRVGNRKKPLPLE